MKLTRAGTIYRFALQYSDQHREALSAFSTASQIADYLDDDVLLQEILDYAENTGVKTIGSEIQESEPIILTQAKAYISRNLIDNEGYYPIIQKIDTTLEEAIKLIESK